MSLDRIATAGFAVQVFDAEALVDSLDDSGDLPTGRGMEYFDELMIDKYMEIDPILYADLDALGIENPILIEVDEGRLIMVDGHHRLAWALVERATVPVVFVDHLVDIFGLDVIISETEDRLDTGGRDS